MMLLLIRIASATCWEMHLKNKAKQNVSLNHVIQNKSLFCDFGYLSVHRLCLYNNLWRWLSWTWNRNISDEFCMVLQYDFFSPEMRLFLSLLVRMICFKEASPPIKRQNSPNAKSYDSASPHSSGDVKLNRSSGKLTRQLMLTQRRQEVLLEVSLILFWTSLSYFGRLWVYFETWLPCMLLCVFQVMKQDTCRSHVIKVKSIGQNSWDWQRAAHFFKISVSYVLKSYWPFLKQLFEKCSTDKKCVDLFHSTQHLIAKLLPHSISLKVLTRYKH